MAAMAWGESGRAWVAVQSPTKPPGKAATTHHVRIHINGNVVAKAGGLQVVTEATTGRARKVGALRYHAAVCTIDDGKTIKNVPEEGSVRRLAAVS